MPEPRPCAATRWRDGPSLSSPRRAASVASRAGSHRRGGPATPAPAVPGPRFQPGDQLVSPTWGSLGLSDQHEAERCSRRRLLSPSASCTAPFSVGRRIHGGRRAPRASIAGAPVSSSDASVHAGTSRARALGLSRPIRHWETLSSPSRSLQAGGISLHEPGTDIAMAHISMMYNHRDMSTARRRIHAAADPCPGAKRRRRRRRLRLRRPRLEPPPIALVAATATSGALLLDPEACSWGTPKWLSGCWPA